MRYLLYLLLIAALAGCVSSGKYKKYVAASEAVQRQQLDSLRQLRDSTLTMRLAVERSRGRDDAYRASQDKYLAQLQEQEDELDKLRGNLSSTNSQMRRRKADLQEKLAAAEARFDTLAQKQSDLIADYQNSVEEAAILIDTFLRSNVDTMLYTITTGAGTATLSVQESLLFRPRTVSAARDEAAFVLRAVTEALLDDPLLKLTIVGHTDNQPNARRGTDNWAYAALRAAFLANELTTTYYVSPNRLQAASHGEYVPIASNATKEGREQNRRVDFVLRNNVGNLLRELDRLKNPEE